MNLNHRIGMSTMAIVMWVGARAFAQDANPPEQVQPAPEVAPQLVPAPAPAQAPVMSPTPAASPPPYPMPSADLGPLAPVQTGRWAPASGFGMAVLAGGGVTDYTESSSRDVTSTGGSWNVRLAFGTRRILGFEASYIGGANTIHNLGGNNHTTLVRNGLEGSLRINAPLHAGDTLLEPYVAGGVGWNAYRVTNFNTATSSASISPVNDNTISVPIAAGFAVGYRGFVADARYTIRPTYEQATFNNAGSGALTNWDFGGMLGYEF